MNPIEEMMEKYGVKPKKPFRSTATGHKAYFTVPAMEKRSDKDYWELIEGADIYPPFTPEKQLELLKYITLLPDIDEIKQYYNEPSKTWNITVISIPEMGHTFSATGSNNDFAFSLAELIITLHPMLTPTQRQEIKEILER